MSTSKLGYYLNRNKALDANPDRQLLGEREIATLELILEADQANQWTGKLVADLGCGDQYIRYALEKRGATYYGLDIDQCNLESDRFPLEDNSCDLVICLALIEHILDPGHFLSEVQRILKPAGKLWMSTPDIEACGAKFWNDPTHVHPYTRTSLRTLLMMNGFAHVLVTPNYRCKPRKFYRDTKFNFFRARHLMPFLGTCPLPVPDCLKGHCTGLFALAQNPL